MRVLIATSEATPYAKTGGLADVAGALLKEFRERGIKASLILPLYRSVKDSFPLYKTRASFQLPSGERQVQGVVWASDTTACPEAYFVECDEFFDRPELYGTASGDYPDNAARFAFFSRAVLETCASLKINPDVIHCNDWQTALIPLYLRLWYRGPGFMHTATLYTIHNMGYQGQFPASDMKYTGLGWEYFVPDRLEFYGAINFMKAGLLYSDLLNTVSPTYAKEILEPANGHGLDGVLRKRREDLFGVLNGIDYGEWDPARDPAIPRRFGPDALPGKRTCKRALAREAGFAEADAPLFGLISRLSSQKGIDLVIESVEVLMNMGLNLLLFGKGEDYFQTRLRELETRYAGRLCFRMGFQESFAHLLYAGCDFLLMPSQYEPCGLGQLIALKYGTIPIVRATGGLADTIRDYDHLRARGNGFLFRDYTSAAMQDAIKRALCAFAGRALPRMRKQAMRDDFSWKKSADKYRELYRRALGKVAP